LINIQKQYLPSSVSFTIGSGGGQSGYGGDTVLTISGKTIKAQGGDGGSTGSTNRSMKEGNMKNFILSGDMTLFGEQAQLINGGAFYYVHNGYGYSYVDSDGITRNNSVFGGGCGGSRVNPTVRNRGTSTYAGNGGANGGGGQGAAGSFPGGGGGGSHNPGGSSGASGAGGSLRIYY
jgi:hypothetical protein